MIIDDDDDDDDVMMIMMMNVMNIQNGAQVSAAANGPSRRVAYLLLLLLLLLKSVEFDDDVALPLSVAGLVMGPHVTSESEIGGTDSAALRTSWTCLRLCGSCVTGCTSFIVVDPAI